MQIRGRPNSRGGVQQWSTSARSPQHAKSLSISKSAAHLTCTNHGPALRPPRRHWLQSPISRWAAGSGLPVFIHCFLDCDMEHESPALNSSNNLQPGSGASANNTTPTSTASTPSGQQPRQNLQPRRSSLINASADALAAHYSPTTSATASFEVSRQATLS